MAIWKTAPKDGELPDGRQALGGDFGQDLAMTEVI
jgi:hypothetical protein